MDGLLCLSCAWNGLHPGKLWPGGEFMEPYEQYYRLPQDVVGHDAALLSYWDQMPAKAQLRLLESKITVSTLGELKMLADDLGQE